MEDVSETLDVVTTCVSIAGFIFLTSVMGLVLVQMLKRRQFQYMKLFVKVTFVVFYIDWGL